MLSDNKISDYNDFSNLMVKMKQVYGFYYVRIKENPPFPIVNSPFPIEVDLVDYVTKKLPDTPCIVTSCSDSKCIYDMKTLFELYTKSKPCPYCRNKMKFDDMFYDGSLAMIAKEIRNLSNFRIKFFSNQEWRSLANYSIKGRVDTSSTILLQLSSLYIENAIKFKDRSEDYDSNASSTSFDSDKLQEKWEEEFFFERRKADIAATKKSIKLIPESNTLILTIQIYSQKSEGKAYSCYHGRKSENRRLEFDYADCAVNHDEHLVYTDGSRVLGGSITLSNDIIFKEYVYLDVTYKVFKVAAGFKFFYIIGIDDKDQLWINHFPSLEKQRVFQINHEKIKLEGVASIKGFVMEDTELYIFFFNKFDCVCLVLVFNIEQEVILIEENFKVKTKIEEMWHDKNKRAIEFKSEKKRLCWRIDGSEIEELPYDEEGEGQFRVRDESLADDKDQDSRSDSVVMNEVIQASGLTGGKEKTILEQQS